jgi:hypothetical protein
MIYVFCLTAMVVILGFMKMISIITGNEIRITIGVEITNPIIFLPSLFYQIYYWVNYFQLFAL